MAQQSISAVDCVIFLSNVRLAPLGQAPRKYTVASPACLSLGNRWRDGTVTYLHAARHFCAEAFTVVAPARRGLTASGTLQVAAALPVACPSLFC